MLGNAWHIPENPEPRGCGGMRDPVGAIVAGTEVTILSGNQYQGDGNPGNQLQDGSDVHYRRVGDPDWTAVPLVFHSAAGNNKYYAATLPTAAFAVGDQVDYVLRIAYDDHETTFVCAGAAMTTADEAQARAAPFRFAVEDPARWGRWSPVIGLPNVAIHAHLLPDGRVLAWGRRDRPEQSLNEHDCTPFVWDPADGTAGFTPQPTLADGTTTVNLFCSGHAFLPDGRLLVAGGHWRDQEGLDQAALFDPADGTWRATATMNHGRWYPTATELADGRVLVTSGSYLAAGQHVIDREPQVWAADAWSPVAPFPATFALYPRCHVISDGSVFLPGPLAEAWRLDPAGAGAWQPAPSRVAGARDYAPSVLYAPDRVLYAGGGNDLTDNRPTASAETIDLAAAQPAWQPTSAMGFRRRHHNATLLPDGTVLVTGGTSGPGFNDLGPGGPVHVAELWDPATGQWTELAAERVDRCYHATAVLLADGRVLSAGGGEFFPVDGVPVPNDPQDSHRDAQIFQPPYLFKGERPRITGAPTQVDYGQDFAVATPDAATVSRVSLLALSSVTHAFNMGQTIEFPEFAVAAADTLTVTAPATPQRCPPGYYLLFLLSADGVPSVGHIVRLAAPVVPAAATPALAATPDDAFARQAAIRSSVRGTVVTVGIDGTCPYGLGACWGAAYEALLRLDGVDAVDPIPDGEAATATLFLVDERLPALKRWPDEFARIVHGSYRLRGVEVTLAGRVHGDEQRLWLTRAGEASRLELAPLGSAPKVQWDRPARRPAAPNEAEAAAYDRLTAAVARSPSSVSVQVTGPLDSADGGSRLRVRRFEPVPP
jgi:galactose oxidase